MSQHLEHFITVIMRAQKAGGGWGDQRNIYLLIFCEITQFPLLLVAINMSSWKKEHSHALDVGSTP